MSPETAIQIMTEEELYISTYNWFEDRKTKSGELGIIRKGDEWQIYVTNEERGGIDNIKVYILLSEALNNFIDRMRAGKRIADKHWQRWSEQNKAVSYENYLGGLEDIKNRQEKQRQEWLVCKDRIYSVID